MLFLKVTDLSIVVDEELDEEGEENMGKSNQAKCYVHCWGRCLHCPVEKSSPLLLICSLIAGALTRLPTFGVIHIYHKQWDQYMLAARDNDFSLLLMYIRSTSLRYFYEVTIISTQRGTQDAVAYCQHFNNHIEVLCPIAPSSSGSSPPLLSPFATNRKSGTSSLYSHEKGKLLPSKFLLMAYYNSYFHEDVEYNHCYDDGRYDFSPARSLIGCSSYDIHDPRYIQNDDSYYEHASSRASVVYAAYSFSQPEFSTQYLVSYCNADSNEPELEKEYDPDLYVSGYDIHQTYGKPLPPSDEICYPRSGSDPNPQSVDDFPYGSVVASYGKDENDADIKEPSNGGKKIQEAEQQSYTSDSDQDEKKVPNLGDMNNDHPLHDSGFEERNEDFDKQPRQFPPGYGLEALDLCEGLFGYWPCLARIRDQRNNDGRDGGCYDNGGVSDNCWQRTADYLFGNPYPYGGMMVERGSYVDPVYSYERHYQQQALVQQVESDDGDEDDDEYSNLHHSQYYEAYK
ncbi:hypothetical protein Ancab_033681 [Ancistrocladus abbreviatus]